VSYQALASAQRYSSSRDSALKLVDVALTILRFQMKKHGPDPSNMQLLHSATQAEAALKANGNVKLALLQLAVR